MNHVVAVPGRKPLSRLLVLGAASALTAFAAAAPVSSAAPVDKGVPVDKGAAPKGKTIFQSAQGYTIELPPSLHQVEATRPNIDLALSDARAELNANILVSPIPPDVTPERLLDEARAKIAASFDDNQPQFSAPSTLMLDGTPAYTITGSFQADDPEDKPNPVSAFLVVTYHGDKAYVLMYGGSTPQFKRSLAEFKQALASLRWTK